MPFVLIKIANPHFIFFTITISYLDWDNGPAETKTNAVMYKQGEELKLEVDSMAPILNAKQIFVYKNGAFESEDQTGKIYRIFCEKATGKETTTFKGRYKALGNRVNVLWEFNKGQMYLYEKYVDSLSKYNLRLKKGYGHNN